MRVGLMPPGVRGVRRKSQSLPVGDAGRSASFPSANAKGGSVQNSGPELTAAEDRDFFLKEVKGLPVTDLRVGKHESYVEFDGRIWLVIDPDRATWYKAREQ